MPTKNESASTSRTSIELLAIFDLEPIDVNLFRRKHPNTRAQRVFGGQVIGQAMAPACRTVEDRLPHSLHAYFIQTGDPTVPIIYQVQRLRDGNSYSIRSVPRSSRGKRSLPSCCLFMRASRALSTTKTRCQMFCRQRGSPAKNYPSDRIASGRDGPLGR